MTTKRPLVILVADGTMRAVFQAFFRRSQFFSTLQCAPFDFDPMTEVLFDPIRAKGWDGGVYKRCDAILRGYQRTHDRALVVIDQQFGGECPSIQVRDEMLDRLRRSGWRDGAVQVVVIDPELEVWLWQDNGNVQQALRYQGPLRQDLIGSGEWPQEVPKPLQPKDTMLRLIRMTRAGTAMAVYAKIASKVSVNGCTDSSFAAFRSTVQGWFPSEGT